MLTKTFIYLLQNDTQECARVGSVYIFLKKKKIGHIVMFFPNGELLVK